MKNLKVGKRLAVVFGITMLLFVCCVTAGILCLRLVGSNFEFFYTQSHPVVVTQLEMRRSLQSAVKNILWSCTTTDDQKTSEYLTNAQTDLDTIAAGVGTLREKYTGNQQLVTDFETRMNSAAPFQKEVLEKAAANDLDGAMAIYNSSFAPLLVEAQAKLEEIGNDSTARAKGVFESGETVQTLATWSLLGGSLVSFGLIIVFCVYITRSITAPIREIEGAAHQMAKGNLKAKINYKSKDELGRLSNSLRDTIQNLSLYVEEISRVLDEVSGGDLRATSQVDFLGDFEAIQASIRSIVGNLNQTMGAISQSSEQVSSGSEQVSSGAQALSQGATEQASAVEELAATITEISAQVKDTAGNAIQANDKMQEASSEINICKTQMEQMTKAMGEISETSGQIGKIIKTIEDIAFQTNILALNAAVEAARAGAAGKGFAVVADEVRSLATKSQEAAKNTTALIESSIRAVENGTQIARDTSGSLQLVVASAQTANDVVVKISEAATEQANSITQVTQGIDQISSVVQTNSATAEESAAASEELSSQAQMLKNLVGTFKLADKGGNSDRPAYEPEAHSYSGSYHEKY